eukprot:1521651-Rhodomonas_salina.1
MALRGMFQEAGRYDPLPSYARPTISPVGSYAVLTCIVRGTTSVYSKCGRTDLAIKMFSDLKRWDDARSAPQHLPTRVLCYAMLPTCTAMNTRGTVRASA